MTSSLYDIFSSGVKGSAQVMEKPDNPSAHSFLYLCMYYVFCSILFLFAVCQIVTSPGSRFFVLPSIFVLEKSFLDVHSSVSSPVAKFFDLPTTTDTPSFLFGWNIKKRVGGAPSNFIDREKVQFSEETKRKRIKWLFHVQFFVLLFYFFTHIAVGFLLSKCVSACHIQNWKYLRGEKSVLLHCEIEEKTDTTGIGVL